MNSDTGWEAAGNDSTEYIQVSFPFDRLIKQMAIAGAKDKMAFVTSFRILYHMATTQKWQYILGPDTAPMVWGSISKLVEVYLQFDFFVAC